MSEPSRIDIAFRRFADTSSKALGSTKSFGIHLVLIAAWLFTGPHFRWSDAWQLSANTPISIVTLLVGLLVLANSIRDGKLVQMKLDDILKAMKGATKDHVGLQDKPEAQIGD